MTKTIFITLSFVVLLTFSTLNRAEFTKTAEQSTIDIKVYFPNPKLPEFETTCGALEFVTRKIPKTNGIAHAALKELFKGPNEDEKEKGMEKLKSLEDYYIGVSIRNKTAIVNFKEGAEEFLYTGGPVCMQDFTLTPISKTLTQFKTIKNVEYAIEGKIIDEWDA